MNKHFCSLLALVVLTVQATPMRARTQPAETATEAAAAPALAFGGDFWARPKLTGDWGGLRDRLATQGLTFDLDVTYTFQGIPSGGIPNTGESTGNTVLSALEVGLDTTKANLWRGGATQSASGRAQRYFRAAASRNRVADR